MSWLQRSLNVAARFLALLSFKGFRHSARLGWISPSGWSLLPGAPALTRTDLSSARTTRLSGRTMSSFYTHENLAQFVGPRTPPALYGTRVATLTVVSAPPAARNAAVISAAAASSRLRTASVTSSTRFPVLRRPSTAHFTQISVTTPYTT